MSKPKMPPDARKALLVALEQQIAVEERLTCKIDKVGYRDGVADGINKAFRYISTGKWET